jgi:hypothetical protein
MRTAVYNLAIRNDISNPLSCALRPRSCHRLAAQFSCVLLGLVVAAQGADWSRPEQQLAHKILEVTGPGSVSVVMENRSSLGRRDSEIIQNGLRSALLVLGIRFVKDDQAATSVAITLSENIASYVWVARIRQGTRELAVVMVAAPRAESSTVSAHETVPLSLHKISLWTQLEPILDMAVLEEGTTPTRIAVLGAETVSLYRLQAGRWQQEQTMRIVHARPWPRDLRGRLIPAKDHAFDVYLPGVGCRSTAGTALSINCRENDDPWPLVPTGLGGAAVQVFPSATSASVTIPSVGAFFAPTRNFFTGVLTPAFGRLTNVPKFYSAAFSPRENYLLWLFAGTDGHVHAVDGVSDQTTKLNWGSDLTSVKTSCGAGWQVLATSPDDGGGDSVQAYEFPDRDPIAVTGAIDFTGAITALWTEAKGDTAIAVARNRETGSYEAFRLAVSCSQ